MAKQLIITVAEVTETGEKATVATLVADAKTFSTGSQGFYANGKLVVGGKPVQAGLTFTVIGSKPGAKKQ